jgi:hypothetical protein
MRRRSPPSVNVSEHASAVIAIVTLHQLYERIAS